MLVVLDDNSIVFFKSKVNEHLLYEIAQKKFWSHELFIHKILKSFIVQKIEKKEILQNRHKKIKIGQKQNTFGDYDETITHYLSFLDMFMLGISNKISLFYYPFDSIFRRIANEVTWRHIDRYAYNRLHDKDVTNSKLSGLFTKSIDFVVLTKYALCVQAVAKVIEVVDCKIAHVTLHPIEDNDHACSFFKESFCSHKKASFSIVCSNGSKSVALVLVICMKHMKIMQVKYDLFNFQELF